MFKLTRDQKIVTAEFFGNFAVAWLAAGLIIPTLEGNFSKEGLINVATSVYWASILLVLMLYFVKKK